MRTFEHQVTEAEAGLTVKTIARRIMQVSSGQFSRLKFTDGIKVDGKTSFANVRLQAGQVLALSLPTPEGPALEPVDMPLSIPYEDEDFWVVDKPAPLPTMPSVHQEGVTLENVLYSALGCPKEYLFRPVNRLDKGTSGLLLVARNAHAQQRMQSLLHTPAFQREYDAICVGVPPEERGVIDLPIDQEPVGVRRFVSPGGKPSVTHYEVLETRNGCSHLHLRLETGRTHQIRVHLAALGCPVFGDYLYGEPSPMLPGRFALHSSFLRFEHPFLNAPVAITSPLPEELMKFMDSFTI